jgi:TonB family protein
MILEFHLHANGSVSEVTVVESKIDPILAELCQAAVKDVAPFAPWPDEMRRQIGKDDRIVRFNFNFN